MAKLVLLFIIVSVDASADYANPPRLNYKAYAGIRTWQPALAIDADGNAYVVGVDGCNIAKVNPAGSLVGCLRVGAGGPVISIAVDSSEFIYAVSISATLAPSATIVKLSPDGSQTLYSRVIADVAARALTLDSFNRLYITGIAGASFATTPGAFQTVLPPGASFGAFAMRLNATGQIDYATYLDGADTAGYSIAADSQGHAWIAGQAKPGGIVWKLDAGGESLLVTVSLGQTTGLRSIAVDTKDEVYVAGASRGAPTTPGALQPDLLPSSVIAEGGYVAKLNPSGTIVYGTYVQRDVRYNNGIDGIAVDTAGNAYFGLNGIPQRPGPSLCLHENEIASLLMVLSADGSQILTSAYLNEGRISSIALDGKGGVYIVQTDSYEQVASVKFDITAPAFLLGFSCAGSAADTAAHPGIFSEVAPGEVVILSGSGFTSRTNVAFDGHQATVLHGDWNRIMAVVPFEVNGPTTQLTLSNGQETVVTPLLLSAAIPAPFPGTVINEDGKVNFSANPTRAGSTISFYMTGAGLMAPPLADGEVGPLEPPYPVPNLALHAHLVPSTGSPRDTVETPVLAAFQAPGLIAGVLFVTVRIPETAPSELMYLQLIMSDSENGYFDFATPGAAPVYIK